MVEVGLPLRPLAAVPQQAVFEVSEAAEPQGLDEAHHGGLAHLDLVRQFRDGLLGAGLRMVQHIVGHPLFRWPQGRVSLSNPVQNLNIVPHSNIPLAL